MKGYLGLLITSSKVDSYECMCVLTSPQTSTTMPISLQQADHIGQVFINLRIAQACIIGIKDNWQDYLDFTSDCPPTDAQWKKNLETYQNQLAEAELDLASAKNAKRVTLALYATT